MRRKGRRPSRNKTGSRKRNLVFARPIACSFPGCSRWFHTEKSLLAHKRLHGHRWPVLCGWAGCGGRFATYNELRTHLRQEHPTPLGKQPQPQYGSTTPSGLTALQEVPLPKGWRGPDWMSADPEERREAIYERNRIKEEEERKSDQAERERRLVRDQLSG